MRLTPRLSAYLFKIGQKLHKGERVQALMKCPECDRLVSDMEDHQQDQHIIITQRIWNNNRKYKDIDYVVVGCEGYWVVDPKTLGLPRGNWWPTYEVIKRRLAEYAKREKGWDIDALALEEDNRTELAEHIEADDKLDEDDKEILIKGMNDDLTYQD
jgi:hypothetical protein